MSFSTEGFLKQRSRILFIIQIANNHLILASIIPIHFPNASPSLKPSLNPVFPRNNNLRSTWNCSSKPRDRPSFRPICLSIHHSTSHIVHFSLLLFQFILHQLLLAHTVSFQQVSHENEQYWLSWPHFDSVNIYNNTESKHVEITNI